jgi:hypothetical protein
MMRGTLPTYRCISKNVPIDFNYGPIALAHLSSLMTPRQIKEESNARHNSNNDLTTSGR